MHKYNIIYIDPPWSYNNKKTGGSMISGSSAKYKTMSQSDIIELPINNITEDNCVLFLWATNPFLPEAIDALKHWGFKYKTTITWKKSNNGMGFWFRGKTEHLLFSVKGKIKSFRCQRPNFIEHKILQHSQKPEAFRQLIEEATKNIDDPKRLELFARRSINGWTCVGDELNISVEEFLRNGDTNA